MRKFFNTVFFVAAVLFFVVFALSNTQTIQISFFKLQLRPVPVSLLILISFLAGVMLASFLNLADRISLKRELRRLKKDLQQKDAQLQQMEARVSRNPGNATGEAGNPSS